ncbi:hypothetical protein BGZ99_010519 [Dissophora globulifera]|uniref:Uncharacterized protein n=1 Tax=Dissophora globulifera TaxID=979702 RepID=A0A9P6R601_9FUNG|nr:hypothetical protein BGZ99_010519 [Dissophora globulifera]
MAHSNPWDEPLLSGHHSDDDNFNDDDNDNHDVNYSHDFAASSQSSYTRPTTAPTAPAPLSPSSSSSPERVLYPSLSQTTTTTVPSTSSGKRVTPYEHEHVSEAPPPSYEATINKDNLPQLHDIYDHLRGPPGQRGRDIKDRIPSESISASHYQSGGGGSSSSSGGGPSVPRVVSPSEPNYGSTSSQAELGLRGPIALGSHNDDDDGEYAQDVDRLLGPDGVAAIATNANADGESSDDDDDKDDDAKSCWTVASDGRAWGSLCYMLFGLLPWTLFCFAWTLAFFISSSVLLIIPPLGYLFMIFSVTSWRALARVDLELSAVLVSNTVRQRYPFIPAKIYIPCEPGPAWRPPRFFGHELPLPNFVNRRLQSRHASRARRPKNLWHRGAKHLRASMGDRHSIRSLFYFLVWKMMFALPVAIVVLVMFSVTVPFMVCLLPTLLIMSRAFANWQYRWAVKWLSEKPAPIVL